MFDDDLTPPKFYKEPAHVRYEYGALEVDEIATVNLNHCDLTSARIQIGANAYGAYHGKKFQTKKRGHYLYIKRIK